MNVSKFFHKLAMIPDVEVVVALLPEVLGFADQSPRNSLLEGLDDIRERSGSFSPTQAKRWLPPQRAKIARRGSLRLEWGTRLMGLS